MAFPPAQKPQDDGTVDGYSRVVNGRVIKVNAYAKKSTSTTSAAKKSRLVPGRPRMAGSPGTYSSGRDIPGVMPAVKKVLPPPPPNFQPQGAKPNGKQPLPKQA